MHVKIYNITIETIFNIKFYLQHQIHQTRAVHVNFSVIQKSEIASRAVDQKLHSKNKTEFIGIGATKKKQNV